MSAAGAAPPATDSGCERPDLTIWEQRKGGRANSPSALGALSACENPRSWLWLVRSLLCLIVAVAPAQAQTAAGTLITNSAQIDYLQGATTLQIRSNTVSATVQATSTPSVLIILRFA